MRGDKSSCASARQNLQNPYKSLEKPEEAWDICTIYAIKNQVYSDAKSKVHHSQMPLYFLYFPIILMYTLGVKDSNHFIKKEGILPTKDGINSMECNTHRLGCPGTARTQPLPTGAPEDVTISPVL